MIRLFIFKNKIFFLFIFVFVVFFNLTIYFGAKRIYDRESKWRNETGNGLLLSGASVIETFYLYFDHHLLYLSGLPSIKEYAISNFSSHRYRNDVQNILFNFAKSTKEIYQISVLDSLGKETIKIMNTQNGTTVSVPYAELSNPNRFHYEDFLDIGKKNHYAPIELYVENGQVQNFFFPVVRIATPLTDDKGDRKGVLIIAVDFSKVLRRLPKNMFVQTQQGYLIALNPDGTVAFEKSKYELKDHNGQIKISNTENIHYSTLELPGGNSLIVALNHNHIGLKYSLQNLILISTLILIIFFGFIGIIGYFNISRIKDKNRAQKALISSLVELTDWRDHETGNHLKRTQNYSIALAKSLHNNPKYRKMITPDFIQDIFDTTPLHDIGKVGIKDSILMKPDKLTEQEFEEMKNHVLIGRQVIQDAIDNFGINESFIFMAKNICGYHHEKFNGQGYPKGLKSDKIPIEARIFALADVYDALRSKRPYKDELAHSEVVKIIRSETGKHFDPDVVNAFLKVSDRFLEIGDLFGTKASTPK